MADRDDRAVNLIDIDTEEEDRMEDEPQIPRRIALHDFLRLLAGTRGVNEGEPSNTNQELVTRLRTQGVISR